LIPTYDATSNHEITASLNKPQNKYSAELLMSFIHHQILVDRCCRCMATLQCIKR